ncbi:D-glycero-beta-D-manno-heptose-7-phosphate kinase [Neisseria sp. WLZKY-1]|uniref:D-glycero-beta-D-manno-heptose-7-phosphate kinase n=1 Tax=Neisseria sp. WLZKY-1 TaxID=3390377 RepID=UPI003979AFF8
MDTATLKTRLQQAHVLIAGDVMLDRYWFGDAARISPEAPVPVAKIERTEYRAGGAANVARNVAALGGQAVLLSVVGDDEAGDKLHKLMEECGVQTALMRDKTISTTVKTRVVARNQQLLRIDFEDAPAHEVLDSVRQAFRDKLSGCDLVILSDYGKGGLAHVASFIEWARQAGKPVLVDPKGSDYAKYAGATLLTPNRAELREVTGSWHSEEELTEKAQTLRRNLGLDALLLTRSEEGMTLFGSGEPHHQPTRAREVFDVSGAGDTVIATVGLTAAAGLELTEAVRLANAAAGVVVGKLGTAVCTFDELAQSL